MTVRLRAHHLLCMLTYASKGYDAAFVARFDALVRRLNDGEALHVIEGQDDLCAAIADSSAAHCHLPAAAKRDAVAWRDICAVLELQRDEGREFLLDAARLETLRTRFAGGQLRRACAGCAWYEDCSEEAANGFRHAALALNKTDMPHGTDIATAILAHAGRPGVAVRISGQAISWPSLADDVRARARRIGTCGPGAKLALVMPNSAGFVSWFLAGVLCRMEVQVLDPDWPKETIESVLEALSPDVLIAEREGLRAGASARVIGINDTLAAKGDEAPASGSTPGERGADIFYTGFTSGSTGFPRGFRRDQKSWLRSFACDEEAFGFTSDDVFVAPGNLTHSLFLYAVLRGLYAGAQTVVMERFRPNRTLEAIQAARATVLYATPTQLDALSAASTTRPYDLETVRYVLSSGSKLPGSLKQDLRSVFPNAEICEFFGSSELSYISLARDGEAPEKSVGRPFPGVCVRIRGDGQEDLPAGEVGKIFVDSPLRFSGYALTDERALLRAGTAIATGDVGYLDADGYLYLVGRADRMIVCSAKNVYPEEVETVLSRHPQIARAAVFGIDDPRRGSRLVAAIKPAAGHRCDAKDLIQWCRKFLPLYKVPREFVELGDWPLTASHKPNLPEIQTLVEERVSGATS